MQHDTQAAVTILYRGTRYCVRFLRCTALPRAVVFFETWLPVPTLDGEVSAEAFFRHRGLNMVAIRAGANDWYQHDEIEAALDAVHEATRGFELTGYGGSMGGFAALAYSERLRLRAVVAVCPQYALDTARAPYERRWREEAAVVAREAAASRGVMERCGTERSGIAQARRLTQGWLIYDPGCVDALHATDIQRHHRLGELRLRFGGHHLMLMLQQAGLYRTMLLDMLEDRFDPADFRRCWRVARRQSSAFWLGLSYALRLRGRHDAALRAALQARGLPHPETAAIDMMEACARIGLGQTADIGRLVGGWADDPGWGEAARWCLSQVPAERPHGWRDTGGTALARHVAVRDHAGQEDSMSDTQTGPSADEERDEALEDTFPASDPPSIGGSTGPEDTGHSDGSGNDTLEDKP